MNQIAGQLREALTSRLSALQPDQAWAGLADAGVIGLLAPENLGGMGLDLAEAAPVLEVLGDLCLPTAFLETAVIAAGLLTRLPGQASDALLRKIAEGGRIAVLGVDPGQSSLNAKALGDGRWRLDGEARLVLDALDADFILARGVDKDAASRFFAFEPGDAGVQARPVPTLDGRMAADLTLNGMQTIAVVDGEVDAALSAVRDEAVAALCVEAAALMARLVRDTIDYVKQREQFGQTLSSFQVVQHRLADMNIQARRARAIARQALSASDADRPRLASAAKVTVCRAGRFVGQNAVQLHGGMGMTAELPISRGFKRLTAIETQMGGADHHIRRFQRLRKSEAS